MSAALKALDTIRTGFVIRNLDGSGITDNATKYHCCRLCRAAGLLEHGWHNLRHAFGTHAAMFGTNPWKLMLWMGHKRIDETMLYVQFAEVHPRGGARKRRPGSAGHRHAERASKRAVFGSLLQQDCSKRGAGGRF